MAEKRREAKVKGERKRYTQLNAEFRERLSEQCKEIEENNIMGKTRDLKKTGDTKGTFHAKIRQKWQGPHRNRENKKRWQEYTELYKKDLHDPGNYNGVITHLEPDILECEVKWALESITTNKASGGDGT